MWNWAENEDNEAAECSQSTLERFFTAHFGKASHVPGLVRYMLHAAELRRLAINEHGNHQPARPHAARSIYKLSRRSVLLRELPNCPRILDNLLRKTENRMDAKGLRRRYDFLLHLPPQETEVISNFVMNAAGAALLEYFQHPNTWPDEKNFQAQTGYDPPPAHLVKQLIDRGVLEAASDAI
jgi:hypothetical protein